jgi:hypothetical protein
MTRGLVVVALGDESDSTWHPRPYTLSTLYTLFTYIYDTEIPDPTSDPGPTSASET